MRAILGKLLYVFGYALILFVFSERSFWAFWRVEDTFPEALSTFVFYFFLAYAFLVIVHRYQVATVPGLVLAGLLYAYLTEGAVAGIFYDPVALFVALPWHLVVSVLLGLHILPRFLVAAGFWKKVLVLGGGGALYAGWALGMLFEEGDTVTFERFTGHVFGCALLLVLGYFIASMMSRQEISFSWRETKILSGLFSVYLCLIYGVAALPPLLVLGLLAVSVIRALKKFQAKEIRSNENEQVLIVSIPTLPWSGYFAFFVFPCTSSFLMMLAFEMELRVETAFLFAIPLFCFSIYLLTKSVRQIVQKG